MCNVDPHDAAKLSEQIAACAAVGCDIIRLTVPDIEAAKVFGEVRKSSPIPMVADIHFDYRIAIRCAELGVDKIRINPGNIGSDENVKKVADICKAKNIPIRIGVNAGSLDAALREKFGGATPEALVESAMQHVRLLEEVDFYDIKISVKASDIDRTLAAYRLLSQTTN